MSSLSLGLSHRERHCLRLRRRFPNVSSVWQGNPFSRLPAFAEQPEIKPVDSLVKPKSVVAREIAIGPCVKVVAVLMEEILEQRPERDQLSSNSRSRPQGHRTAVRIVIRIFLLGQSPELVTMRSDTLKTQSGRGQTMEMRESSEEAAHGLLQPCEVGIVVCLLHALE